MSVVNALSERLDLEIWRNGQVYQQSYERGKPIGPLEVTGTTQRRGTKVTFKPDPQIFETIEYSFDTLAQRLRELAFLNGGILITIDDERDGKSHKFQYEGGIVSFVEHLNKNKAIVNDKPIFMKGEQGRHRRRDRAAVERRLHRSWSSRSRTTSTRTRAARTCRVSASALTRTINAYAAKSNLAKDLKDASISGDDIREGLTGVISVKIPQPQFEGQTKTKLGNTEVKGIVETIVNDKLGAVSSKRTRPSPSGSSARRSTRHAPARRRARRATSCAARARSTAAGCPASSPTARSAIRRRARSTSSRASRPAARPSRDVIARFQAILPIKGKILNVEKARFDKMLSSDEIKTMIAALGCGIGIEDFDIDKLRYHRIIIMTDADVDGSHIRTLLLTFFYRQMPQLDRTRPHLHRAAAALPRQARPERDLHQERAGARELPDPPRRRIACGQAGR